MRREQVELFQLLLAFDPELKRDLAGRTTITGRQCKSPLAAAESRRAVGSFRCEKSSCRIARLLGKYRSLRTHARTRLEQDHRQQSEIRPFATSRGTAVLDTEQTTLKSPGNHPTVQKQSTSGRTLLGRLAAVI